MKIKTSVTEKLGYCKKHEMSLLLVRIVLSISIIEGKY